MDGGICDQCGCRFTTELGKAKFCPNCGSDKWDSGKQDQSEIKARSKIETIRSVKMQCLRAHVGIREICSNQ